MLRKNRAALITVKNALQYKSGLEQSKNSISLITNQQLGSKRCYNRENKPPPPSGGGGFWSSFFTLMKQRMAENEKLVKAVEDIKETTTAQAASKVGEVVSDAASVTKETVGKSKEKVSEVISPISESIAQTVSDTAEKVANSETAQKVKQVVGETVDYVKSTQAAQFVESEIRDITTNHKMHLLNAHQKYIFRSKYGRDLARKEGFVYNPYLEQDEKIDESTLDTETTSLAVADNDNLYRHPKWNKMRGKLDEMQESQSILVRGISKMAMATGDSMAALGDKVFKENEFAQVFRQIREMDPKFDVDAFMYNIETHIAPSLLKAFFEGDQEFLKSLVTEECFARYLFPSLREREFLQVNFDARILDISHPTLLFARFDGDSPALIITFEVQYIHCLRDRKTGEIVEGSPDEIRLQHHMWNVQPDNTNETKEWEIAELSFGGTAKIV